MNRRQARASSVFVGSVFHRGGQPVRILAAIDTLDLQNPELSGRIIAHAARPAKRVHGELHVVSAYSPFSGDTQSHRIERYLPALRVKARDRRRCAIRQLLRGLAVEGAAIHVHEGESRQVIDATASSLQASVVVGASTRGESAERVVGRLPAPATRALSTTLPSTRIAAPTEFAA